MNKENFPFRITVEHWGTKVSIELPASDITFDEYMESIRQISIAVFSEDLWEDWSNQVKAD